MAMVRINFNILSLIIFPKHTSTHTMGHIHKARMTCLETRGSCKNSWKIQGDLNQMQYAKKGVCLSDETNSSLVIIRLRQTQTMS